MPARYTSARFVGREEAFGRLAARLDDAAHGRARTILIAGTAGVGVTRFIDEATERMAAVANPMAVLRATAWPAGADEPYGPIVRAIGPTLRALPPDELAQRLGSASSEIVRLLPGLGERLATTSGWVSDASVTAPERRQARTMEGVLGLLGRLGEDRPVVLVLEELHRADAATRALVTFLARISRTSASRSWARSSRTSSGATTRGGRSLGDHLRPASTGPSGLPPLDRDELAALIEGIQGERASASLLLLVAERSDGLPLVAEELLAARRELPSASLTGSFDELVVARMAIRSAECRRVARLLALAERPLTREALAAVAAAFETGTDRSAPRSVSGPRHGDGIIDADLRAGLEEAIEHGFMVEVDGQLTFRHESIGRAVAQDLLPLGPDQSPRRIGRQSRRRTDGRRPALAGGP